MKRVVVITGVSGGIGRATATAFADEGWLVVGMDLRGAEQIAGVHHFTKADVSSAEDSRRAFDEVAAKEGQIDALVNNAAIQVNKSLLETTPQEWDATLATNLGSVYLAVRNAHPLMRGRKTAIVNISSVHALATSANIAAYAATKGAILALTRALAIELAPDDIRVNAVVPGAVDTPMLHAGLTRGHLSGDNVDDLLQGLAERHVLRRVGQPEEVAQAILFLADSERSSFMTGQALVVDGGATARLSTE
jgi:NAD(P)-dependent dehydrogenase (short-subunit alcohol dehydrogenase family)